MSNANRGARGARQPEVRLSREQVVPVFQPIVDLAQGEVAGYETLSRPTSLSPFTSAGEMFDWAENTGRLWELEEITRAVSLTAARDWPEGAQLFLNTSPQVFATEGFAETIGNAVRAVKGLTPGRVVLELTERSSPQTSRELGVQVARAKELGFQIAIDDVGAGTSGLNRIMALRPNWLKLDRGLIDRIDQDRVKQNLLRFFLHFSRLSGVKVVAEGIEREEELVTLIDLGVPYGQGYYLGRPGERGQQIDPGLAAWLREKWLHAGVGRVSDPRQAKIARFARRVETIGATTPARDAAAMLLKQPGMPGFVVTDGKRLVGWCDRETVLKVAAGAGAAEPVGFIAAGEAVTVTGETTVTDAIDVALSRDDRGVTRPLIVSEGGTAAGIVGVRDLLHAAANACAGVHPHTAALTGLPGRVRADEFIGATIAQQTRKIGERGPDAAIVDIRSFADYNGAYGYGLGDELLKQLGGLLQLVVAKGDESVFIAHLGDDRFFVAAPTGVLERRMPRLAQEFERAQRALSAPTDGAPTVGAIVGGGTGKVGLRIAVLRNVFRSIRSARDLYRLADEGRGRADRSSDGIALLDPRMRPDGVRLSA